MNYTNINGKIIASDTAAVSPDNSAFRYGVGLFETMLVQNGAIRYGHYHWERLFAGLRQLRFELPPLFTAAMMETQVLRTVKRNNMEPLCRVRLHVYGGSGGIFGPDNKSPLYVIECYPLDADTLKFNENGLVAGVATGMSKSNDSFCNLKSGNSLAYAMAARQAKDNKWNDALVCNTAGNIIESAIANVFWVKEGVIYTPPLAEGCVAGVMRRQVLHIVDNIVEQPLTRKALLDADEVMLTNAIKGLRWVGAIEDSKYGSKHIRAVFVALFGQL